MTIDEIIRSLTAMKSVVGVNQFTINEAIDTMRKYQMFQAKYAERLKADMVAMLTEIQLELDEMKITKVRSAGFAPYSKDPFRRGVNCSKEIIQQKINSLKEDT